MTTHDRIKFATALIAEVIHDTVTVNEETGIARRQLREIAAQLTDISQNVYYDEETTA